MSGAGTAADFTLVLGGIHAGRHAYARKLAESNPLPKYSLGWRNAPYGEALAANQSPADALRAYRGPSHQLLLADVSSWHDQTPDLLAAIDASDGPLIIVSREAGLGIVPIDATARHGRDELGRLNQALAERAGRVVLVTAGLPLTLKGVP